MVSPSNPIPDKGSTEDEDIQPPHREAANYYRKNVADPKDGEFRVTMAEPSIDKPAPIVIVIGSKGAIVKAAGGGFATITSHSSPRAGHR